MMDAAGGALALPTSSLQCPAAGPSSRGLTLRQVGSSGGKFNRRAWVLLAWRRRCLRRGFQRTGSVRVMAMGGGGRKKAAKEEGENNERPEAHDLMELEFGRLLGEPQQATLAKVIGGKANLNPSYIDIEKKPLKEFKSSSSSEPSEAEFARLLKKEGRRNAQPLEGLYKPQKVASEEDMPGLVKPPSRPGQTLPQAPRRPPFATSAKADQAKRTVPLVTFGPGGFAAQSNKPRSVEEDDYMSLVQELAISSPDFYKTSWPKINTVPPFELGKSKKAAERDYMDRVQKPAMTPSPESVSKPNIDSVSPTLIGKSKKSVHNSSLRRPRSSGGVDKDVESRTCKDQEAPGIKPSKPSKSFLPASPGPVLASSPSSDISEERFSELLELAGSTGEHQEISTKFPLEDEIREVASISISTSDLLKDSPVEAVRLEENADAEPDVDLHENATTDLVKGDEKPSDPEHSLLWLMKKASRITPVRPLKRFPKEAINPGAVKASVTETAGSTDERLAGWSDEVKAAVKRSEAALPSFATQAPSEIEFDQLLERRKDELRRRPVPLPTPEEVLPDPAEVSTQQRASSRPSVPSPKPPQVASPFQQQRGGLLSDKRIASKEEDDQDWARAEALRESKTVEDIVFTRAISNGMLAKFGSLVGFLAAYELSSRRRPPSFSAWAQENGFKINKKLKTSVVSLSVNEDPAGSEGARGTERSGGGADEEYKRLLDIYGKFRTELLLALIGKTAKVVVVALERERKRLRFSEKEAEGEGQELAQKRAKLMTSLNVGDAVKCTVKKVTNFGAFVKLQGVPALIHISELSWNRVTDPSTVLKVGQEVEVKVCRLDRYLQRISLSLKQMQPDPLWETLESLDLRGTAIDEEDEETTVMPELVGLTSRLEAYMGIDSVQIGRRLVGNALAPTFQVYLSDQLDDGFKLLARSGNLVQEVLVQTALDRDSMKDAIRQCTFSDNY